MMSEPDRLAELRRQRSLVHEHLGWIDRQIAEAEARLHGQSNPKAAGIVGTPLEQPPESKPAGAPPTDDAGGPTEGVISATEEAVERVAEADAILNSYRRPTLDLQRDVRTGCFLYFAAAFLILGIVVVILYFALRHP